MFATDRSNIAKHIKNIISEEELVTEAVCAKIAQTASDKKVYQVMHYNLDMVISVGYRVNSTIATRFRKWATQTLKEYLVKGFVMDDKRLSEGNSILGKDYFDELTQRVRTIRISEKRFYQKVQDVFSATSYDYDSKSPDARDFYATIQNKFHYAVTGKTAAELISSRVDGAKQHAGLTTFEGSRPTVAEAKVAKNYMLEDELRKLYLISEQFLSFAELRMSRKTTLLMKDWKEKLDQMLKLNDLEVLRDKGRVSHEHMENKVKAEMALYLATLESKPKVIRK